MSSHSSSTEVIPVVSSKLIPAGWHNPGRWHIHTEDQSYCTVEVPNCLHLQSVASSIQFSCTSVSVLCEYITQCLYLMRSTYRPFWFLFIFWLQQTRNGTCSFLLKQLWRWLVQFWAWLVRRLLTWSHNRHIDQSPTDNRLQAGSQCRQLYTAHVMHHINRWIHVELMTVTTLPQ